MLIKYIFLFNLQFLINSVLRNIILNLHTNLYTYNSYQYHIQRERNYINQGTHFFYLIHLILKQWYKRIIKEYNANILRKNAPKKINHGKNVEV